MMSNSYDTLGGLLRHEQSERRRQRALQRRDERRAGQLDRDAGLFDRDEQRREQRRRLRQIQREDELQLRHRRRVRRNRRIGAGVVSGLLLIFALTVSSSAQGAPFALSNASVSVNGVDGSFSRQAGAHPDFLVRFDFPFDSVTGLLVGNPKDVRVDLPVGMVGDPTAVPECPVALLVPGGDPTNAHCPPESQIGIASVAETPGGQAKVPVYNMEHSPDVPGLFGFNYLTVPIYVQPQVRASDYGISSESAQISQTKTIYGAAVTIWGVPADPVHNAERTDWTGKIVASYDCQIFGGAFCQVPSVAPRKPFLASPTSCSDAPAVFGLVSDSWQAPGVFDVQTFTTDIDGTPFVFEGCDKLAFAPEVSVRTLSHVADAPTGLDFELRLPQNDSPDGLATAHVKRVEVTLPEGMSVSPGSAAGLGACSPAQIGLKSDSPVSCPDSARLGTVQIETPVLPDPISGDVFLAKQDDNPFGSLVAMYIAAHGPGFTVKLAGKIDLDERTGRLIATFDNNPQVPFSKLHMSFRGGSQAALANPPSCGSYNTHVEIVSWASEKSIGLDSPLSIDEGCEPRTFSPSLSAGTVNPAAGADSPFTLTVTRADRTQYLAGIAPVTLPTGLLARIGSVAQCPETQANTGSCDASSQIGTVATLAGPGAQPLPVTGRVYLTGPYHGAPFGLSIVVPTAGQAGPFDLGNVIVRGAITVDRTTAQASVQADPLPSIIRGVPLRIRQARVTIDRPNFTFNPTSCAPKAITAGLQSLEGASTVLSVAFRALGCGDLELDPKLALRFTGNATTDGAHPGISAKLTDTPGGANIAKAIVKLPLSVALDPDNAQALCTPTQRAALACPTASIVGQAKATSVLPHPLTGPVYFVQGLRTSKTGQTVRTLPKLWIPLSADGVTVDINASSDVDKLNRLVTTFDDVPDAPISQFELTITGGKHGIIVVSGKPGTCGRDSTVESQFTGQNNKILQAGTPATIDGCKPKITKTTTTNKTVTLKLAALAPQSKITLTGRGIKTLHRTTKTATTATLTTTLTTKTRNTLKHHNTNITLNLTINPQTGKTTTTKKTITLKKH